MSCASWDCRFPHNIFNHRFEDTINSHHHPSAGLLMEYQAKQSWATTHRFHATFSMSSAHRRVTIACPSDSWSSLVSCWLWNSIYLYTGSSSLYHTTSSKLSFRRGGRESQGNTTSPPTTADTRVTVPGIGGIEPVREEKIFKYVSKKFRKIELIHES